MDRIKSILTELSPTCETRFPGVLWAILLLVTLNYIRTPLGGDQQVNIALAQQAELIGQFPRNLLEAWTLRGIGYKTLVITPDTTALYFSDGTATYYLEAESHLRYYYPLPLQRISWRSSLRSSEIHQRVYNKALEYEGRITVLQPDWFPIDEFPELEQKIENKYCVAARVNINYAGRGAGPGTQNIVIYERCTNKTTRCSY